MKALNRREAAAKLRDALAPVVDDISSEDNDEDRISVAQLLACLVYEVRHRCGLCGDINHSRACLQVEKEVPTAGSTRDASALVWFAQELLFHIEALHGHIAESESDTQAASSALFWYGA